MVPKLIADVLPFMRFSHVRYDKLSETSPCVHIFCTLERSNICIASIPRPQKDGDFKIKFGKKNIHLEENVANNVPISISPHRVFIRVRRRFSTRLAQCWDIRWVADGGQWSIKESYGNKEVYTDPKDVPLEEIIPWVPSNLRQEAWCDLLRRVRNGEMTEARDSLAQKRVLLPHTLIETILLRQLKQIARIFHKTGKIRKVNILRYAFSTGNWGFGKVGVVTALTSHNRLSEFSDLRKVKVATSRAGGVVNVNTRHLLPSHYGFYCCVETTEGQTCGLIRQLATTATVSNHMPWERALQLLEPGVHRVYINGLFVGIGSVSRSRDHCRHVCVFEENGVIHVRCDGGRLVRPVRIHGEVKFIDSAMQRVVQYEEIFRAPTLGLMASMLPYLHHNQSPRSMYVIQMLKQCVMVNSKKKLWYPQKPVVAKCCDGFFVQNVVIAILCTTGHNQEDSLIISSRAFDFGMFRHDQFVWNTISQPKAKHNFQQDENHDIDGLPFLNSDISPGDLVFANGCRNSGPVSRNVIRVELSGAGARARTREIRIPQQGDKFCSLHGQKGICGRVERPENLPFTRSGITPDLIINPHAFPSRMTIGQILEVITGKANMFGRTMDPVAFTKNSHLASTKIKQQLKNAGFAISGKERMWDGISGLPLQHSVFIGVASYLRLKHMVDDKIYARGTSGPIDPLTSQPASGRASGGGLRLGEMEKDCLLAHGALGVLGEKLITHSDPDSIRRCSKCSTLDGMCSCCNEFQVNIPMCSATKLLVRELAALNIKLRYTIKGGESIQ